MYYILILLLPLFIYAAPDAKMKISKDVDQRASIVVVDASPSSSVSKKLHKIFVSDFKISGNFVPDSNYNAGAYDNSVNPAFRAKEYVLKYKFLENGAGAVLMTRLIKASNSKIILEKKYSIPALAKYPFVAHRATSDINNALGYKSLEWINRYVVYARYTGKKQSEILLADYTFNYSKTVIRGGLNLFPQWGDPKQRGLYYTSYETGTPTIYHLDIYTGKRKSIVSSDGMIICSDVSRDGSKLLLTMAPNGQPDIYEYTVASGTKKRLTKFSGIDVSGKYSDNEKSISFVSNRMGQPNIFKKSMGSTAVTQLIFHGKKNNSCDTHGKKVIYSSKEGRNKFNLYIANTAGGSVRPLTSSGVNQFPRFAPDGNTILYIKRSAGVNSIGYIGLQTNQTMLFPLGSRKIQSIDW
ncbi:MAG TPA: Tol-Pal system protein TolB [Sulfurovum sp.]|nr:Tol-Pal system protein TolB [Sulfurovum sp.]